VFIWLGYYYIIL